MHNELSTKDGWRVDRTSPSLPESHRTILIAPGAGFWRKLLAFSGPGYLVAVGYMDPGNWATDLAGGSGFGYTLLSIILLSNLMAILLQALCARLGIATQRDLAEVIGSAIALNLLFKIPLVIGVCITAMDVLAVLYLQNKGFRYIEALVVVLILTIGGCFLFEVIFSKPELQAVLSGFVPHSEIIRNRDMLYIAIGILGATVMPHNLYLHSSVVQTRNYEQSSAGKSEAIKFATIDSSVALMFALFINAAILIVAAATFHSHGRHDVAEIQDAYKLLSPTLGVPIASALFAFALLASGQNSTLTGTLAGQIVMEGFLNIRLRPWLRRLITRLIAIIPAVIVAALFGTSGTAKLLLLSQVILSLQLSFAVIPLVLFTSDRRKMGEFVSPRWLQVLAWVTAGVIVLLNGKYLCDWAGISAWA